MSSIKNQQHCRFPADKMKQYTEFKCLTFWGLVWWNYFCVWLQI